MDETKNMTIVIPVRIDSKEREENLETVLKALIKTTCSDIIILEADSVRRVFFSENNSRVNYIFIEDKDSIFHRTRYLNILIKYCKTDIVGVWDTDVLIPFKQINQCVHQVLNGVTLCYPYDGHFIPLGYETSIEVRQDVLCFLENIKTTTIKTIMGRPSVGGAFIFNKEQYIKAGGENENFYGWGPEDAERLKRMEILDKPIRRVSGPLFHLYHPKGINSLPDSGTREKNNIKELIRISQMNKEDLKRDVKTWS